jgi:hypothetical protein
VAPILLVLVACTTVETLDLTPYQERDFSPTTEVEVLTSQPTRPYTVLGQMWVPADDSDGVLNMRKKAMEIGADAIVLLGERDVGAVAIPLDEAPGGAVAVPERRTYAAVIRYER